MSFHFRMPRFQMPRLGMPAWLARLMARVKRKPVEVAATTRRPARKRRQAPEIWGSFYFRDAILDQLDHYFVVLARMKKGDRQSYDFFSRVGAHILPLQGAVTSPDHEPRLSPWWRETLPASGGVFFGDSGMDKHERDDKVMVVRALYFQKYKPRGVPMDVQPVSTGTVYLMTAYWDMPNDAKWNRYVGEQGRPQQYPVVIAEDGSVRVLRVLETKKIETLGKHGRERGKKFGIPVRRWGIPETYKDWAADHAKPVEDFLRDIFVVAAESYMLANAAMTRVAVTKGRTTGVFSVDIERTPYFFRDREVTITKSGARRPIFHVVRPHERITAGGHKSHVRMHFRGERDFGWNDYAVSITVPGWHHLDISTFDVGSMDETSEEFREAKGTEAMIGAKGLAKKLARWIRAGEGGVVEARNRRRHAR